MALFKCDIELNGLAPDEMYISTRDLPAFKNAKDLLERMYLENIDFIGDSPTQFQNQFILRFEDTVWHLCLLDYLKRSGFELQKPSRESAPDIKAKKDGKTYWIEAINTGLGQHIENPIFSKNGVAVEWGQPNDPRVTARLLAAVREKAIKFNKYIPDPVHPESVKIIAVSAHGNLRVSRGSQGRSFMDIILFDKVKIQNPSGKGKLELGLFTNDKYAHIDEVIYCPLDPITYLKDGNTIIENYKR